MVSVTVTITEPNICFYDAEESNGFKKVQKFLDKWGEEVPFFTFSEHGKFGWSEELSGLNLDDYEYENHLLWFMGSDVEGDLPLSFGEGEPEDDDLELYSDLFNLVGSDIGLGMIIEESNTQGYWSAGFSLTKGGLKWWIDDYTNIEEENEDW